MFGLSRLPALIIGGLALAVLIVGILWLQSCSAERTAAARARLAEGQAGAAIESGKDAVNTIGNRSQADAEGDAITRENEDAIRNAAGANAAVDAAVREAGLNALCRRAAYRDTAQCRERAKQ